MHFVLHQVMAFNPFLPTVAFNICCPRDCVSRHNGGTSGAPLKPLRDDSALRTLSSLRDLRGAPAVPPLCRETQSLGQQMLNATVGINGLTRFGNISLRTGNKFGYSRGLTSCDSKPDIILYHIYIYYIISYVHILHYIIYIYICASLLT